MYPDLDLPAKSKDHDMSHCSTLGYTKDPIQTTGQHEDWNISESQFIGAVSWLSIYYSIILIVASVVCNSLSFVVLSRRAFRESPMSVYLRYLSFSDFGAVMCGLTRFFQMASSGYDIWHNLLTCRILYWMGSIFLTGSSWTLVAVTTERVISIIWPHQVRNRRDATVVVITIFLSMVAIYAPVLRYFGHRKTLNAEQNTTSMEFCTLTYDKLNPVFFYVDSTLFAFLPMFFLIIFNTIILTGVIKSRKRVTKLSTSSACSFDDRPPHQNRIHKSSGKGRSGQSPHQNRFGPSKRETSLTITLLVINVTFIVCNFPICAYQLGPHYQSDEGLGPIGDSINSFLLLIMYTNNSLNFLLYCITGSRFRKEVKTVISELFICLLQKESKQRA